MMVGNLVKYWLFEIKNRLFCIRYLISFERYHLSSMSFVYSPYDVILYYGFIPSDKGNAKTISGENSV